MRVDNDLDVHRLDLCVHRVVLEFEPILYLHPWPSLLIRS